ncbi:hypothetical protein [Perlucidibaca aquatica]|uniref:hypothetical protein n=1 Tax=Perlucidibaca aquatica TaxID=1852776 RepID=UPI00083A34CF|nr:hypothetical protein [Perlucidibaca aquatica]
MEQAYEGRQLSQPIVVTDLLNGRSVTTMQPPYLLTEADFLRLKGGQPITATLATIVFSGVVGYAVSLGPKIAPMFEDEKSQLSSGELSTIVVGTIASAAFYAIGFWWPNDKMKTMKKISKHFDSAPPSSHFVGGKE